LLYLNKDIAGKSRVHSSRDLARSSRQEADRIQEPRHAKAPNIRRAKRVKLQFMAHLRGHDSVTREAIEEIKPQMSRIRALRWESLAAEVEMLNAAPSTYHKGVPLSSIWRWPGDANLAV
jgi:hypothetical protein